MLQITTRILTIIILLVLFLSACSSSEPIELQQSQVPTPTQIVEYGASLDEWQEAVNSSSQSNNVSSVVPTATPAAPVAVSTPTERLITVTEDGYWELLWEDLVPQDYRPEVIMAKYQEEMSQYQDGDPEAMMLYMQMQSEFNNAPVNESLDDRLVKIPGFIAPLEYDDNMITEFLLVPYFGACIHTPPPPVNQTILVTASEGNGINLENSFSPVWVYGVLSAEGSTTELAEAGYSILDASVELYTSP